MLRSQTLAPLLFSIIHRKSHLKRTQGRLVGLDILEWHIWAGWPDHAFPSHMWEQLYEVYGVGQWEGRSPQLPSPCHAKGGIPSTQRYLPTYLGFGPVQNLCTVRAQHTIAPSAPSDTTQAWATFHIIKAPCFCTV